MISTVVSKPKDIRRVISIHVGYTERVSKTVQDGVVVTTDD